MKNPSPIIGLEVHVELSTKSKMFCGCPANHFGVVSNTHTCPVCLGLPGALPVPNKRAVESTILLGLALGCKINEHSKFDRKNYFYPDLPKGYQISQYDEPIAFDGAIILNSQIQNSKSIRIRRVHLEEDTGKLQHEGDMTLVDLNRSGVPLVEIVTEPDFRSIEEVDLYLKKLQKIIRYLGISGADMEKGSMRLEPSVSLTEDGSIPDYRVELKNINSFRFARKALEFEITRQLKDPHKQQTRGWSEAKNETVLQREKEGESDYRYFPEPDIPPMHFTKSQITFLKSTLPELPDEKSKKFQNEFGISFQIAEILAESKDTAEYFEKAVSRNKNLAKDIANWIVNKKADINNIAPEELVAKITDSKQVSQIDEKELEKIVAQVLAENPKAVEDYKSGKTAVLGFLIGKVVKLSLNTDKKLIIAKIHEKVK